MISITFDSQRMNVSYDGKKRATFELGGSFLSVGHGKANYSMSRGSFTIRDKVSVKKALVIKGFEEREDRMAILFDEGALTLRVVEGVLHCAPEGLDKYNRLWLTLPSHPEECFYGSGETFTAFNLKGLKANVWVAEHINVMQTSRKMLRHMIGLRDSKQCQPFHKYETYYAQPTFVSSEKYFFHNETTARCVFWFKPDKTIVKTDSVSPFCIGFAEDYEKLLGKLTEIVGRQPELPDWVYDGQILGIQGGTEVMLEKYQKAIDHGAKVAGLWIQDWEGRRVTALGKQLFWNWQWDKDLYPGLDETIKSLNEKGVKVLGYCNPFLAIEKPLYKEASEKGYCVKNKQGEDYMVTITTFPAAMVDLSNPDAYQWIKNIIKENMIGLGLSGWMADFGEYLPTDCVLFSGEDPLLTHNTWPVRWAKVNREAVEESGKLGEIFFFTRSGYTGTGKYSTMMWNGDNHPDFSYDFGLPSIVSATLSLTACGFGLTHSDIGGYTSLMNLRRSKEVLMRWYEMNTFSVLMRGHEGLNPDINVQFDADDELLDFGGKLSRIHAALKPYLVEAVKKCAREGVGVARPMFFYYDEREAYENAHQYLLGRDVLVCPVLRPRARKQTVYLPEDEWVHLWSGKTYSGGHVTVDAPLGETPVFIRKSAENLLKILSKEL